MCKKDQIAEVLGELVGTFPKLRSVQSLEWTRQTGVHDDDRLSRGTFDMGRTNLFEQTIVTGSNTPIREHTWIRLIVKWMNFCRMTSLNRPQVRGLPMKCSLRN